MIRQPENIQYYEREEKTLFIAELTILWFIYHFPAMHVYQDMDSNALAELKP